MTAAIWNEHTEETLATLWNGGKLSAAEICLRIPGTTRCAIIGKARRLGLVAKKSLGGGRPRSPYSRRAAAPSAAPISAPTDAAPRARPALVLVREPIPAPAPSGPAGGISFEEIHGRDDDGVMHHRCAWPLDMPKDAEPIVDRFCGGELKPGRPYCEAHCERAYTKRRTKTEILSTAKLAPSPQRYAFGG
jgi:GcrA cell cycle regulator